jgi:mRNA-degrading endonuclease toxin of MazEF toxin-antitoxin module
VVGPDQGLKRSSAVNLDHLQTVEQARLEPFVGSLSPAQIQSVCRALTLALGCD